MWFISVEVEQGTSAPPPKKNPGSAPETRFPFPLITVLILPLTLDENRWKLHLSDKAG